MAVTSNTIDQKVTIAGDEYFIGQRAFSLRFYTTTFSLLGVIIILVSLQSLPDDKPGLLLYIGLGILAEILGVELSTNRRGNRFSGAAIISIAGVLTYGPLQGALIYSACELATTIVSQYFQKGEHSADRVTLIQRSFFNIGRLTFSTLFAGLTYIVMGGVIGDPLQITNIFPLFMAVFVSEASNILIQIGSIHLQTGLAIQHIWEQNFRRGVPFGVVGGALSSIAIAMAHAKFGITGLTFFFLPVLAIGVPFRLYINQMQGYANRLEQAKAEMDRVNVSLLETFGAVIDAYDEYTHGHSSQVALYAAELAERMSITGTEAAAIERAALVHDIGKIGAIYRFTGKPGPLTEEEKRIMERHPIFSAEILHQMKGLEYLIPLVRNHHERWDGQGYPAGLVGEEIPLGARVIALADAVDAMCSSRPYRNAMTLEEVKQEVRRNAGIQFDPRVVSAFLQLASEKGPSYFRDSATKIGEHGRDNLHNPQGLHWGEWTGW